MSEPQGIIDYIYGLFRTLSRLQSRVDNLEQIISTMQREAQQPPITSEQLEVIARKVEIALTNKLIEHSQQPEGKA